MNAESERASLPDRVEAARLPDKRLAEIRDELERLVQFDIDAASPYKPQLTLALIAELQERRAADACEAERNPNTDRELPHKFPSNAPDEVLAWRCEACGEWSDIHHEFDAPCPIDWRRPVSSEDVHREAAE